MPYVETVAIESPQHRVKITKPFYFGIYTVTQREYQAVMGQNPSYYHGDSRPVEMMTLEAAIDFCRRLSGLPREKAAGAVYRLPTEAEWEYACRAGTTTRFYFGDSAANLSQYAWWGGNARDGTHPVGQLRPNAWGLFDMNGNVGQFCAVGTENPIYRAGPTIADPNYGNPIAPQVRGTGFGWFPAERYRSAYRSQLRLGTREGRTGFRVVGTIGP